MTPAVEVSSSGTSILNSSAAVVVPAGESARVAGDVPAVLEPDRLKTAIAEFTREYEPLGPTELALVRQLADHALGGVRWTEAAGAVERQAARDLPTFAAGMREVDPLGDVAVAVAMTTDAADRCEKHALLRSRAFLRTLDKLEAIQAARRQRDRQGTRMPALGFSDEVACERYLADRFRRGLVACSKCGATRGAVIASRKCFECGSCKAQAGLRARTVMAYSPISLLQWFNAIRLLLWHPTIGVREFAVQIGSARKATAREMIAKIRAALAADDASQRLAGLDEYYTQAPRST